MQTIESLKRKIKNTEALLSVVQTMKALAAVSVRHYERAVDALAIYNRTVEMGLHILLRANPDIAVSDDSGHHRRIGLVVFSSDQGLCGQFNERIVTYAVDAINALHIRREYRSILAVGARGAGLLEDAGQLVQRCFATPGSVSGVTPLIHDLLLEIDTWRFQQEIDRILLYYNQPQSGNHYRPHTTQLLPLDLAWLQELQQRTWPSRVLPTFTMEPQALFSALVCQHLFVTIYRACVESLACEDISRLAAMQSAERNIEERLDEFTAQFHHLRQSSITAELLDIVAGYEAVMGI